MIANAERLSEDAFGVIESSFLFREEKEHIRQAIDRVNHDLVDFCDDIAEKPDHVYMYIVGLFGRIRGGYMHIDGLDKVLKANKAAKANKTHKATNDLELLSDTHTVLYRPRKPHQPFVDLTKTKYNTLKVRTCRKVPYLPNDVRISGILGLHLDDGWPFRARDEDDEWP